MILITRVNLPALLPNLAPLLALANETLSVWAYASSAFAVSSAVADPLPANQFIIGSISVMREAVLTKSSQKKKE
jgi:hypothetical protein